MSDRRTAMQVAADHNLCEARKRGPEAEARARRLKAEVDAGARKAGGRRG